MIVRDQQALKDLIAEAAKTRKSEEEKSLVADAAEE